MAHPIAAHPEVPGLPAQHGYPLLRALRIIHPFPTLLNVAATAGLAFVAAGGEPSASVLARMLLVMLCAQSAIGNTNDIFDRDLDAAAKPWKPIPAGIVPAPAAIAAAIALLGITIGVGATLGAGSLALAALGTGCGLIYDVRLKRTPLSAVPYMIAIPTLPLWVWLTLGEWDAVLLWVLPLGALIGLALHLANTLPDIEGDSANGVRGLAHALGARGSMFVAWAAFALALAISLALGAIVSYDVRVYVSAFGAGVACLAAGVIAYAIRRDEGALQFGFGILSIGAAILAAGWLAAVT
jgi:4-hydroxybenzoate polyprenyltransferase